MTRRPCPTAEAAEETAAVAKEVKISKYRLKLPSEFRSEFEVELEQAEEEKRKAEVQRKEAQRLKRIDMLEYPPDDEYRGYRVHAWVVIIPDPKGPRSQEITEPFFIEPSSGLAYKLNTSHTNKLYFGIESIWNDLNYWVNVQPRMERCTTMNWDLSKAEFWAHLLPGEPFHMRSVAELSDEEVRILQEKHLDMPASYVSEIRISVQDFRKRYPNGRKTILYKKARVERFAPYVEQDGLIERATIYDDYDYVMPADICEKYENRMDHLIMSKKCPQTDTVIDYYKRGRPDRCKEHHYFMSSNDTVDSVRVIEFYSVTRHDGLLRLETNATSLIQHYLDREDLLQYRCVRFSSEKRDFLQDDIHFRPILSVVEKYNRNENVPANRDIAMREFEISENEIRLAFHYNEDNYTRATRTYTKPPLAERGERLVLNPAMMQEYNPDPNSPGEKALDLFYELEKQLDDEDRVISQVRAGEDEVMLFLQTRRHEYHYPRLTASPFDVSRIPDFQKEFAAKEDKGQADDEQEFKESVDPLRPYLAELGNPSVLTEEQAYIVHEKCLANFKQTMVDRANKLLRKISRCSQDLEKTQALLTQGEELTREQEEKILDRCNELTFELQVLEVRLDRHRRLAGLRHRVLIEQLGSSEHFKSIGNNNAVEVGE